MNEDFNKSLASKFEFVSSEYSRVTESITENHEKANNGPTKVAEAFQERSDWQSDFNEGVEQIRARMEPTDRKTVDPLFNSPKSA